AATARRVAERDHDEALARRRARGSERVQADAKRVGPGRGVGRGEPRRAEAPREGGRPDDVRLPGEEPEEEEGDVARMRDRVGELARHQAETGRVRRLPATERALEV